MNENDFIDHIKLEMERLAKMAPLKRSKYYQLNLFANENDQFYSEMTTHWVGFTDENPKREIREASYVDPTKTLKMYEFIEEPLFVINTEKDFIFFIWVTGGNSIIEESIAQKYIKHLLTPSTSTYSYDKGFVDIDSISKEKLNKATNPKLRMKIFNRDKRRCKICGASPANNEHVELHIHHIIPYSLGGLTDENNLITLCHTCHKGLEPHLDYSLFNNIGVELLSARIRNQPFIDRISKNIIALNKYRHSKKFSK